MKEFLNILRNGRPDEFDILSSELMEEVLGGEIKCNEGYSLGDKGEVSCSCGYTYIPPKDPIDIPVNPDPIDPDPIIPV